MHQSLSSFLRAATDAHFEGPIPATERDRIRIVENAERAFDQALSPLERAIKSLSIAYADVMRDSALVEASRQLRLDAEDTDTRQRAMHRRRAAILADSANWLRQSADKLAEQARSLAPESPPESPAESPASRPM